jgi:REP element-mobilizing transposase RayT
MVLLQQMNAQGEIGIRHAALVSPGFTLHRDEDRAVYLKLLRENIESYKVPVLDYCLMSNHVHLTAVPTLPDGLALALRNARGRYAAYWNAVHGAIKGVTDQPSVRSAASSGWGTSPAPFSI